MEENMSAYYHPPPPGGATPGTYQPSYYQPQPPPPGTIHVPYIPPQAPPPEAYAAATTTGGSPYDQVRTLFVAGLPEDVKPRELYNLFREFPGYESSHLRTPPKSAQPFAFATFTDQASALAALHALNGMVFDLEKGSTLHIDLAKSNSRPKRLRTDDEWSGSDKKPRESSFLSRGTPDSGFGSVHLPGMANSAYNTIAYPSAQSHSGRALSESAASKQGGSSAPPCPTLFVANLGPNCTEEELIQVFSRCPGFLKLKIQTTYGTPVAFVDFQDTACSTGALNHWQGTVLYSSPAGEGMRLEYAKSRMGMRRKPK